MTLQIPNLVSITLDRLYLCNQDIATAIVAGIEGLNEISVTREWPSTPIQQGAIAVHAGPMVSSTYTVEFYSETRRYLIDFFIIPVESNLPDGSEGDLATQVGHELPRYFIDYYVRHNLLQSDQEDYNNAMQFIDISNGVSFLDGGPLIQKAGPGGAMYYTYTFLLNVSCYVQFDPSFIYNE